MIPNRFETPPRTQSNRYRFTSILETTGPIPSVSKNRGTRSSGYNRLPRSSVPRGGFHSISRLSTCIQFTPGNIPSRGVYVTLTSVHRRTQSMETCLLIQRRMRRAFRPRRRPWNSSRLRFRVQPRMRRFEYTRIYIRIPLCSHLHTKRKRDMRGGKVFFFGIFGCKECDACFDRVGKIEIGLIRVCVVREMENVGRAD